ncbi:MAG: hypothetical protein KA783_09970 [Chitinophagales bacterium]|nr:hypothetical protein [Chitinophagales bacterium]
MSLLYTYNTQLAQNLSVLCQFFLPKNNRHHFFTPNIPILYRIFASSKTVGNQ